MVYGLILDVKNEKPTKENPEPFIFEQRRKQALAD